MPAREHILHKVRTALGRSKGESPEPAPPALLRPQAWDAGERIRLMLEKFPGKAVHAGSTPEAREHVARLAQGVKAVGSRAALLERMDLFSLPGVSRISADKDEARAACAAASLGITTAEYGMADTGSLVVFSTGEEGRLLSLLPPVHLTILPAARILTGLDELFTLMEDPAKISSSMVFIGGPSRTADIEQILTLGVHGPRELHLVLI